MGAVGGAKAGSALADVFGGGGGRGDAAATVDLSAVTQRWDGFTAALQQVRADQRPCTARNPPACIIKNGGPGCTIKNGRRQQA